jgi:type VI secretion system protein ImpE
MTPEELFHNGRLGEAIVAQNACVKAQPTDVDARHLLSVFLCFSGELDRAFLQLDMIGKQDPDLGMAAQVYRSLMIAESQRREVFHGDAKPLLPPECPADVEARLDALLAQRRDDSAALRDGLERAESSQSELEGKQNGEAFTDLRDYDDLLGPVLEVYAGDTYLWVPFERIRTLEIKPPVHLLDLLYIPATLEDQSGAEASVHLPALYEGSYLSDDDRLRTGKMTDWVDAGETGFRGVGQKVLLVRAAPEPREVSLLEIRSLEFPASASSETSGG